MAKKRFGGSYREQFYSFLENLGVDTKKYHKEIKMMITTYVNAKTEDVQKRLHEANNELDRLKNKKL